MKTFTSYYDMAWKQWMRNIESMTKARAKTKANWGNGNFGTVNWGTVQYWTKLFAQECKKLISTFSIWPDGPSYLIWLSLSQIPLRFLFSCLIPASFSLLSDTISFSLPFLSLSPRRCKRCTVCSQCIFCVAWCLLLAEKCALWTMGARKRT